MSKMSITLHHKDMGDDLLALIEQLGSPVNKIEPLTTQPCHDQARGSWKLQLADGRTVKARRLETQVRAETLERLSELFGDLPLNRVLAHQGNGLIEEWLPGPCLDSLPLTLDLAETVGEMLGKIARAGQGNPLLEPQRRNLDTRWQKLEQALHKLVASRLLSSEAGILLLKKAQANKPDRLDSGLVHLDFQPRNLVLTHDGPRVIDNELLDIGILDQDLARTWYLWPMTAPQQTRFLRGYEKFRSPQLFLLHELFWSIQTLASATAYAHRTGQPVSGLIKALERLATGDLPRAWISKQPASRTGATERIRLGFLCDYLAIGGQERICLNLLSGLDRSQFDPYVYAFRGGALVPEFQKLNVPLLIGSDRDPLEAQIQWTDLDKEEKATYRDTLASALKRDQIDAALVFAWRDGIPAAQRAGVRVLIEKLDGPGLLAKIADKSPFDRVVCESATLRKDLLSRLGELGLEEERIELIYPGIDVTHFDPTRFNRAEERMRLGLSNEDLIVGTVSRLIPDKNIGLLIKAFAQVNPANCPGTPKLLILGPDGGAKGDLEALVHKLELSDRVQFLPPTQDVATVLSVLDVFGMTSLREGLPTALLEAMAMGLPILTTGTGSIPEVMNGNGFLLPGFAPESLGKRLSRLLCEPELRATMGNASHAYSARFAQRHSIGRYEDLIKECLVEKPTRAEILQELPQAKLERNPQDRLKVLAVVARFKWTHIDYLVALGKQVQLRVVVIHEFHAGAVANGRKWGLDIVLLDPVSDPEAYSDRLQREVDTFKPDIVHMLYYLHEKLTLIMRDILNVDKSKSRPARLVFECRDPLSTMEPPDKPGVAELEKAAIQAADGWVFVSEATRTFYEQQYELELGQSLIVPHGFAERTVGPPAPKLSATDGRLHIALVGNALATPNDGRYYGNIIRTLCNQGVVVHSHFHPDPESDAFYTALGEELQDYHPHPKLNHREDTILSRAMSVYDLMGVFHELDAPGRNESRTLAMCMPTKAVCGWLLGGIPIVCYPHYKGLIEWIKGYEMGFVVNNLEEVGALQNQRAAIQQVTRACLEHRHLLTHETQASRLKDYYQSLLEG